MTGMRGRADTAGVYRRAMANPAPELFPDDRPREDHFVHLHDVSWADYRRVLELRGERSSKTPPPRSVPLNPMNATRSETSRTSPKEATSRGVEQLTWPGTAAVRREL